MKIRSIEKRYYFDFSNKNVMNSLPINSTYNTSNQIYFLGKDKNPNQIVVLATECVPYSVAGGIRFCNKGYDKSIQRALS